MSPAPPAVHPALHGGCYGTSSTPLTSPDSSPPRGTPLSRVQPGTSATDVAPLEYSFRRYCFTDYRSVFLRKSTKLSLVARALQYISYYWWADMPKIYNGAGHREGRQVPSSPDAGDSGYSQFARSAVDNISDQGPQTRVSTTPNDGADWTPVTRLCLRSRGFGRVRRVREIDRGGSCCSISTSRSGLHCRVAPGHHRSEACLG